MNWLVKWIQIFEQFLRSAIDSDSGRSVTFVLRTLRFDYSKLELFSFPLSGVVEWPNDSTKFPLTPAVWRIDHQSSRSYLYICLINIAKLRESESHLKATAEHPWRRAFEVIARKEIENQAVSVHKYSHMVICLWVAKQPNIARKTAKNKKRYNQIQCRDVILIDLQPAGFYNKPSEDRYARQVIKKLIVYLVHDIFWVYNTHGESWEDAINNLNFKEWLFNNK